MELDVKSNGLRCRFVHSYFANPSSHGRYKTIAGHILGMFAVSILLYRKTNTHIYIIIYIIIYIYINISYIYISYIYIHHIYIYIYTHRQVQKQKCHIYHTCHVKEPRVYHNDRVISLNSDRPIFA